MQNLAKLITQFRLAVVVKIACFLQFIIWILKWQICFIVIVPQILVGKYTNTSRQIHKYIIIYTMLPSFTSFSMLPKFCLTICHQITRQIMVNIIFWKVIAPWIICWDIWSEQCMSLKLLLSSWPGSGFLQVFSGKVFIKVVSTVFRGVLFNLNGIRWPLFS